MKQQNYEVGKLGERIAEDFLTKKSYQLIDRNFHTRYGEIDLIVTKENRLVFVEVKLKIGEDFGTPEEMIDKRKLRQIEMTGESFLMKYPSYKDYSLRIDAVCIVLDNFRNVNRIVHYENITG